MARINRFIENLILCTLTLYASNLSASYAESAQPTVSLSGGINISIVERPFTSEEHKIGGCSNSSKSCLIDERLPYGSSGLIPKTYVKSIIARIGGKVYNLPSIDLYDAWGSKGIETSKSLNRHFGGRCNGVDNCVFRGVFSDGAGAIAVQWEVTNGVVRRTVLTGDSDILSLFLKNIDPPSNVYD